MSRAWWAVYRDWYFRLATLGCQNWEDPPSKQIYESSGLRFMAKDLAGHWDEAEEQLYAVRRGWAGPVLIPFKLEVPLRLAAKLKRRRRV